MSDRNIVITRKAVRRIRGEIRKRWDATRFVIKSNPTNRAVSVHWSGEPDERVIQAIGNPLLTGVDGPGLWFFQTHHNER
jgi:hypothetical protein